MKESRFCIKKLTPAELGQTRTHEIYIRLSNDFDYLSFFPGLAYTNGTVEQVDFNATNLTDGHKNEQIALKFVYYANSNREKRLPSLSALFDANNVEVDDFVILESRTDEVDTKFYITFKKSHEMAIAPNTIYYTSKSQSRAYDFRTLNIPLQQIFYGAPGTGKSHGIQEAEDDFAKVIRTTFHPDSDYSTFVGAYKPIKREQKIYSVNELAALWGSTYPTFPNRPEIRFASIYYKSLIAAGSAQYPNIFVGANTNVVNAEVPKGIAAAESYEKIVGGGEITYDFTPQAFTQAYIEAWKRYEKGEAVLLVIEEINRGNCAQIFGDLFQLLDRRDDGFSSYPIVPDTDLQRFVAGQGISVSGVQDARGNDISAEICNGTKLLLPPNLFIWATMNTSDQSLFPIDSAFKRRWDWKYTKIKEGKDDAGQPLGWTLNFVDDPNNQGQKLCWWDFIKKLNTIIESMTDSADKQLGYFFCKANDAKEITPEVFVGKVVFYLWNDVFKMCGFDDKQLFTYERDNNGTKVTAALTFPDFYNDEGDVDSEVAKQFVLNVLNWKKN